MNIKWISIKERLPDEDGAYPTWETGRNTWYKRFYKNGQFYDKYMGDGKPNKRISHWAKGFRGPLYEMAENIMQERKAGAEEMQ